MILTSDFHTHILPGIDDGCQSIDDSVEMIRKEQTDGIETVFLTPHFYPQQMYPDSFLDNRQQAMEQLLDKFDPNSAKPRFILGAEVLFCPGMSQWDQLDALTLGETKYILIEIPFDKWSDSVYAELTRMYVERELTPVLAHIERYIPRLFTNHFMKHLASLPILLQSNCAFLTEKNTQRLALKLIKEKRIHLIGSDCHGPVWRPPNMAQAREILLNNLDQDTITFLKNSENLILQR